MKMSVPNAYRAYTNIALIKYWGKRNKELFLPMTSSLSLTLEGFYTETELSWYPDSSEDHDQFVLNGQIQEGKSLAGVSRFLDLFRQPLGITDRISVNSYNHVPTAAGLASSASAFAALACASNAFFETNYDAKTLSTYARQGSGSATRSLFGGFTLWHMGVGNDSTSSYAEMIDPADWDLGMVVVMINKEVKKISSRVGMDHTVTTSPFYRLWPETVAQDLELMLGAIEARDFTTIGEITEHNAMKMHATVLASKPSFTYWQPESLIAMDLVRQLRQDGIEAYFTMDAGPNVKILCRHSESQRIQGYLSAYFREDQLLITGVGPAPHPIAEVTRHD